MNVEVDMFDRLPTPFGLVRAGVAPDHPKIKSVIRVYQKTAARSGFSFFGNVEVGRDISTEELAERYHAVIYAYGSPTDRRLGIPGEDLPDRTRRPSLSPGTTPTPTSPTATSTSRTPSPS